MTRRNTVVSSSVPMLSPHPISRVAVDFMCVLLLLLSCVEVEFFLFEALLLFCKVTPVVWISPAKTTYSYIFVYHLCCVCVLCKYRSLYGGLNVCCNWGQLITRCRLC